MTKTLSAAATAALIDCGTNRQGTPIPTTTPLAAVAELVKADLIGPNRGLTRKGTIARERAVTARMDAAF